MKKRILSAFLAVMMLVSVVPVSVFAEDSGTPAPQAETVVMENTNQSDGVVMRKTVVPHKVGGVPDGTVDIIIEAYTTGVVRQTTTSVPTDIVLVLDVSGSMDDVHSSTTVTTYDAVNGSTQYRWLGGWDFDTAYGFSSTSATYYVNIGTDEAPHYVTVQRYGQDSGKYDYYYYYGANDQAVYVYPRLSNNPSETREFSHPIVQFYRQNTRNVSIDYIDALKSAVDSFIETTHQKNAEIAATGHLNDLTDAQIEALQHRIAVVKFADDSYYGGSASLTEGNHKNEDNYNYTEVVKNLTVADGDGHEALITAVNALTPGGATSIDYGLTLAQMVLDPNNAGTAQRNKVVLVFSDGEPNHSNGFDTTVANTAINLAKNIKQTAKVYSISVASDTDVNNTTSNLNKFFHYVSSNYPNASDLNTPGTGGNAAAGYYLVPSGSESLSMIFQAIAQQIESPTIELGESAEIVDTMSTFFTIPSGTNSVTLYTSDRVKNGDGTWGWSEAIENSGLSCTVQGKTVEVHGFDYDDHYVSDTPRTRNGSDYYGTALIMKINATPDYSMIDTHASLIQDGKISSNDGSANLLNTAGVAVAGVESPYIQANTVVYQYTDPATKNTVTYKTLYRLAGGEQSVITDAPVIPGYTFNGWSTTDVTLNAGQYTMPEKNIVFTGSFTANKHNVSYKITGYNPGATAPAGLTGVDFGTDVTVAADLTYPGYTFTGWQSTNPAITADQATFTMPDKDVELIGYFTANTGIPYKTIHYIQNLDGTYSVKETVNGTGTTDATVTAATRVYEGFTLDTSVMGATVTGVAGTVDTVSSGKITADGQLTLHQFHTRNKYTVRYAYEGSVPGTAPALPLTKEYYHGEKVTVAPHTEQEKVLDQTFAGWHTLDKTTVTDDTAEFTMPLGNITLYGIFSIKENVPFHIHHYLQNADGSYPASPNYTGTSYEVAGTVEYASEFVRTIPGYTYDPDAAGSVKQGTVSENPTLTLKLYYQINKHNVVYQFETPIPAGATLPAGLTDVAYNTSVTVAAPVSVAGYIFSGWRIQSPEDTAIYDGKFHMPDEDVVLVGSFTARTNTPYRIEYYWQNVDGVGYTLHEGQNLTGTTDATVTIPEKHYTGFTFNGSAAGTKLEGTVAADGSLVLKRFYDRNKYSVTYVYEAGTPAAAGTPVQDANEYYFGQTVTVLPDASLTDYNFLGWYTKAGSDVTVTATAATFTMPAADVTLYGEFYAKTDVKFTIQHFLQMENGTGYDLAATAEAHGVADTDVIAENYKRFFAGYTFHHADPATSKVKTGLVLKLYYNRNTHSVTYIYEGTVPGNANPAESGLTALTKNGVLYDTSVTVAAPATAQGYIFSGWSVKSPEDTAIVDGKFDMPDADVVLVGSFTARTNTPYRIEYYWQNVDGVGYTLHEGQNLTGTTDATVTIPEKHYTGFTFNGSAAGTKLEGTVAADGSLVLKRFYDRNKYSVTYVYEAGTPAAAGTPVQDANEYYFGQTVTVLPDASLTDYNFLGWYTKAGSDVTVTATAATFTMPAADVTLYGEFYAKTDVKFTIQHFLQMENGTGYDLAATAEAHGVADTDVIAENYKRFFAGYTFHHADPATSKVKSGLVLKLYYNRNTHSVTYIYEGTVPGNANPAESGLVALTKTNVPYGTKVKVADPATAEGYIFSGWMIKERSAFIDASGEFVMPDKDIVLVGSFEARTNTVYRVEYYWQNITDDGFALYEWDVYNNGTTGATVHALEKTYTGLTLDKSVAGTVASGTVLPDGSLVLKLYYTRNTYTVEYKYESDVSGAPALPGFATYRFGQNVTVAADAVLEHYNFHGWYTKSSAFAVNAGMAFFTMPAENLTLWGEFKRIDGVHYKVEHYLPDENGNPSATPILTEEFHDGIAGETVTGTPKNASVDNRFAGYVHDPAAAGSVLSGTVVASSDPNYPLTLKLYYKRNTYKVVYEYVGVLPANRSPLPAAADVTYLSNVTLAPNAQADGYTFSGWTIQSPAGVSVSGNQFTMPAHDVILVGYFHINPPYVVEYWLQTPDHQGYVKDENASHTHSAPIGATVEAHSMTFEGYTENTTHPDRVPTGVIPATGTLTLKLYYDRNDYTVTYVFEDSVPAGAVLPGAETKHFGDTVTTPVPTVAGYTFSGWRSEQIGNVTAGTAFQMPSKNVVLKGSFVAGNATYTVEHYLMNDSGNYDGVTPHVETKSGVVGDSVRAVAYQEYLTQGAKLDHAKIYAVDQWEGVVSATTPLVLKLYYSREATFKVVYHYVDDLTQTQWRDLGWPDLPTDTGTYYTGATVTALDVVGTKPSDMSFEGWFSSDPTILVAPGGTFTMPALTRADKTIHLYGKWVYNEPQEFIVKYFVDGVEQTHMTKTYPLNTRVKVMDNLENTSSHAYSGWSTPVSATSGVSVVLNDDDTFTMTKHGEVHIFCTTTPIAPVERFTIRYYLDNQLYWEGGCAAFQRHFMLDAPRLPAGYYFSGWSVPRTPQGLSIKVLYNGLGEAVFTMPGADVVIYGTTARTPIPDGTMKIHKVVEAPDGFTGNREYTFRIYQVIGDTKTLVHTETVKVNSKTGEGSSPYFDLPQGNNYLVEEVGAGVLGYALTTVATDEAGNVIPYGSLVTVKPRVTPTVITFTNTYADLSLETRDHFGYIIGYQDDTVRPEANITRAEVATIFFRLLTDAKRAQYWSKTNSFSDVTSDDWYNNAISTLAKAGALSGYEDGTFRPNQPITRAELVKIAMSFYGTVHSDSDVFNDVGEHWAAAFINGAADLGFVNGYGDETFQPDRYVTRAEAIKIINRTLNRAPDKDHLLSDMITWVDNMNVDAWYYAEIQEATNSHTYTWDKTSEIWEKIRPVRNWSELEKSWSEANDGE